MVGTPGEKRRPSPCRRTRERGGICGDFLDCCKTREKPFRDIELAANTMTVCHLGVIAYELQATLKWDPAKQEFPGDEEANRFLDLPAANRGCSDRTPTQDFTGKGLNMPDQETEDNSMSGDRGHESHRAEHGYP